MKDGREEMGKKAVAWWNERVESVILPDIQNQEDQRMAAFKWGQLVWQEIMMFIDLGEVREGEIDWLTQRRGFSPLQRQFLEDALKHLGLM